MNRNTGQLECQCCDRFKSWLMNEAKLLFDPADRPMNPASTTVPKIAPYGSWASPITSEFLVGKNIQLGQICLDGDTVVWSESRPREQGRNALVRCSGDGAVVDLLAAPWNARSQVHEYGGGAFLAAAGQTFFVNFSDQRIHSIGADGVARPITAGGALRYADLALDSQRVCLIAVREDHRQTGEPVNALIAIDLASGTETVLAAGHDFYSNPCLSPDGRQLAWLSWDHPNMPWDGSQLWLATFDEEGLLPDPVCVAGGPRESIFQPQWSPGGELHFASDRSGWWNLYRLREGQSEPVCPMAAEFGTPQWQFAMSMFGFDARGRIICSLVENGISSLAILEPERGTFERLSVGCVTIRELRVGADFAVFAGAGAKVAEAIVHLDLPTGSTRVLRSSSSAEIDPGDLSVGTAVEFTNRSGLTTHAWHYRPTNGHWTAPESDLPPLIVISHGGPTGMASAALKWSIQFWTSRGFAVLDVNYGGSAGFGRVYRERLVGQWGVVDVQDVIDAAQHLVDRGLADPKRIAIKGGSAGGYTTLAALSFHDFFAAGSCHFGIGDLEALARDTHKFESRYLDSLIGPWPDCAQLYRDRSPIHHTDRLTSPMILFQGELDKAVPPEQARKMFEAVRAKGLPVALLMFSNEGHGFRHAENIRRTALAELYFFGKVFGFVPADTIEPIQIENLSD
jgi:dipeptidyl aminopeptidase/acylaminoacyl peptidase